VKLARWLAGSLAPQKGPTSPLPAQAGRWVDAQVLNEAHGSAS